MLTIDELTFTHCEKCNDTRQRQCTPDCPQAIKVKDGRGWHCDVDARYEHGCPSCPECMLTKEWIEKYFIKKDVITSIQRHPTKLGNNQRY